MTELLSLGSDALQDIISDLGGKPFMGAQLSQWLSKGVPFEEMTNLPKPLRASLRQRFSEGFADIVEKHEAADGTVKLLLSMSGGGMVECVIMRYKFGNTLCVSTQVGCRMGCVFCASGREGLVRSLTAGEMRSEFLAAQRFGEISNVVLMGSGEPLDNYDNVIGFIRALGELHGVGMRHISLSTCGLVPGIERLTAEGLPVTLCISLHSAIDEKRRGIIPAAAAFSVKRVLSAAHAYFQKTGRRIIMEYTLIRGFNDGPEDIDALVHALHGMTCHINVIPLNEAAGGLQPPLAGQAKAFAAALEKRGLSATVRRTLGGDIEGACGQLKLKREKR